jgi:hypothetical protein
MDGSGQTSINPMYSLCWRGFVLVGQSQRRFEKLWGRRENRKKVAKFKG